MTHRRQLGRVVSACAVAMVAAIPACSATGVVAPSPIPTAPSPAIMTPPANTSPQTSSSPANGSPSSGSPSSGSPTSGGPGSGSPANGSPGSGSPTSGQASGSTSSSPTSGPTSSSPTNGRAGGSAQGSAGSLIPAAGAYLGAYVQPQQYTASAEIAADRSFERSVNGRIAIVHDYHPWLSPFPSAADRYVVHSGRVLLLTWSGASDTKQIIAGSYDSLIRTRARAVKRLGRPILMEFRHEMDRPNLQSVVHGPKNYIAAWDHIRAIFNQVGAKNVGWVWCPTGYGFQRGRAQAFYPGNSEVDWVCADIYSPSPAQSLRQVALPFLRWARHTGKPVLIGEFAVGGGQAAWPRWLRAAGKLATTDAQIKGMLYFDADGIDSNGHPFKYWLGDDKSALAAFGALLTWRVFRPAGAARQ